MFHCTTIALTSAPTLLDSNVVVITKFRLVDSPRSVSGAFCNLDFLFLLEDDKPRIDAATTTADSAAAAVAVILVCALFLRVLAADLLPQGSMRERLGARFVRWLMGLIKFNWNDLGKRFRSG